MSAFRGFEGFSVSLGSTIVQMRDQIRTALTGWSWRCPRGSHTGAYLLAILGDVTSPANAFDHTDTGGSTIASTSTLPKWIGFQASAAIAITKFAIMSYANVSNNPKTFTLEFSDNGSSWTVYQTWTNIAAWVPYETRQFVTTGTPGAHAYWRLNFTVLQSGTTLQMLDLKFWASDGSWVAPYEYIDLIPPVSETIGDAYSEECVRLRFTGTTIGIEAKQRLKVGWPQTVAIAEKTAGAVAGAVTVNGVTVTQSVTNAGWTAKQNLRQLFYDLQASVNANFTAWSYEYQQSPPQNADDALDYIYMVNKTVTDAVEITVNANVNIVQRDSTIFPGTLEVPYSNCYEMPVDLISGWFYYLQVNDRAFQLASKTNTSLYGPIYGWFRPNADAVAYSSVGPFSTLSEAFTGFHDVETPGSSASQHSYMRGSHFYGISNKTIQTSPTGTYVMPISGLFLRGKIQDYHYHQNPTTTSYDNIGWASGIFGGTGAYQVANDFQVHTTVMTNPNSMQPTVAAGALSPAWVPPFVMDSIYKFIGTSTQETTNLVQDTQTNTTLTNAILYSDVMSGAGVVVVGSTSAFPSVGYFIIGDEGFHYTGKTATTFTGVTRARYGSFAANHYSADKCYLGQWFVKINGGALLAGNVRPV